MTIRRIVGSFVSLVLVSGALIVTLPSLGGDELAAAEKGPTHFQSASNAVGARFLAGPFPAGTQPAITSLTVAAPGQATSTQFGIRVFHGGGASCQGFAFGPGPIFAAVPADATLHLIFPEPLVATHATESWCLQVEQVDVFTQITIVGVTN